MSLFAMPHLVERTYAARDLKSLKCAYFFLSMAPWLVSFVGLYLGVLSVQILAESGVLSNPPPSFLPFNSLLEELIKLGGFAHGIAVITITASLAAVMSTADSVLLSTSHLVVAELVNPTAPEVSGSRLTMIGRATSLIAVGGGLAIGLQWDEGLTDLISVQTSLLLQIIPVLLIGLYSVPAGTRGQRLNTEPHPWCVTAGAWTGFLVAMTIYFGYAKGEDDVPINSGVVGAFANVLVIVVLELYRRLFVVKDLWTGKDEVSRAMSEEEESHTLNFPDRPVWDVPSSKLESYGRTKLTSRSIHQTMSGVTEPFLNLWLIVLVLAVFALAFPFVPGALPPLDEKRQLEYDPGTIGGIPSWAMKWLATIAVLPVIYYYTIYVMPNEFPSSEQTPEEKTEEQPLDTTTASFHMDSSSKSDGEWSPEDKLSSELMDEN